MPVSARFLRRTIVAICLLSCAAVCGCQKNSSNAVTVSAQDAARKNPVEASPASIEQGRAFYSDMKSRARAYGRDPAHLKICPGVRIIVGATDEEADDLLKELNSYIDWETGRQRVAHLLGGADLSGIELSDRIPAERLPDPANVSGHQSRAQQYWDLATKDRVTLGTPRDKVYDAIMREATN